MSCAVPLERCTSISKALQHFCHRILHHTVIVAQLLREAAADVLSHCGSVDALPMMMCCCCKGHLMLYHATLAGEESGVINAM